ncbi:MAG: tyrosine protein phosphatase [Chromatiales bacterium]|nr:tyrosine protein phosphatase [Chromatiales bacterium]
MITPALYPIPTENPTLLALMPRPRSGDWLEDELQGIRAAGVDVLVSLLETAEEWELGLTEEERHFTALGGQFVRYPIPDLGVPPDLGKFAEMARALKAKLDAGFGVGVHCRAGIGRSGMLACAILIEMGIAPLEAVSRVSKARGVRVPDTDDQEKILVSYRCTG